MAHGGKKVAAKQQQAPAKWQQAAGKRQQATAAKNVPAKTQQGTTAPEARKKSRATAEANALDNSFIDLENLDWITEGFWGLPPDYRGETTDVDPNERHQQDQTVRSDDEGDEFNWHYGPQKPVDNENYLTDAAMHVLWEKDKKDPVASAWYARQTTELSHSKFIGSGAGTRDPYARS
ncbi:hypothetical protein BU16DRAFT_526116 [Lophium mytilinum]|uniref:Uncharacterized protein n=1 Tax=Lophium mytilinum TaxID=390894 RepID=A0A6A6QZN3_9PEZI|nr:hypothetical protein BU16DRAFT_526116 [Lophium mytilinum]